MKKRSIVKVIALCSSASLLLSGCNSFVGKNAASYPLMSPLSLEQVKDYYAKANEYDAVVSKNVTVHDTTYITQSITGQKANKLKELTEKAEGILGQDTYELSDETQSIVSEDTFNYIKASIDNKVLSDGKITDIKGALGYYFVDKEYKISAKTPGDFTDAATLVGLDGAFYTDGFGEYAIDVDHLGIVATNLNKYYLDNNILKSASFDASTATFNIKDGVSPSVEGYTPPSNAEDSTLDDILNNSDNTDDDSSNDVLPTMDDGTESLEDETESNVGTAKKEKNSKKRVEVDEDMYTESYASVTPEERKIKLDIKQINSVAGSSLRQAAIMPSLNVVYNIPIAEGTLSGYGIYTEGGNGLKLFGFNRNDLAGTLTLRYVFKDASNGSGEIIGTNVYIAEEEITNGFNVSDSNVIISDTIRNKLKESLDRADRLQVNDDLSGMMGGGLYEDMGFAILRGFKSKSTRVLKYMSTIRQILKRDTANNAYLLETETTTTEGARSVDCYGTYRDKYYVVIQQQGDQFKVIDQIKVSREMTKEPSINPDSVIQKRLIALNLSGEVSAENKEEIRQLLSDLYTASTNRLLTGPYEYEVDGKKVTIEKGMYDCFQKDTSLLSSMDLEYINSRLRGELLAKGEGVDSTLYGKVSGWISGYNNQAELTTEELITFEGTDEGHYMQVYYLVSKMNDYWVIDERTIIDEYDVDGNSLSEIRDRIDKIEETDGVDAETVEKTQNTDETEKVESTEE